VADNEASQIILKDYQILCEVERDASLSQRDLARLSGLNLATINQIIKRLIRKGCIKTRRINAKRVAYFLTPQGFAEKIKLVMAYAGITINFFATIRKIVTARLRELQEHEGISSASIVGIGELAEAVYLSIQETGLKLTGVYSKSAGDSWLGHKVLPLAELSRDRAGVVIIAEFDIKHDLSVTGRKLDLPHLLSSHLAAFGRRIYEEK